MSILGLFLSHFVAGLEWFCLGRRGWCRPNRATRLVWISVSFVVFFPQAVSTLTTVQDLEIRKQCLHRTALPNFVFFLRKHENAFCKPFCDATSIATQSIPSYVVINVHACQRSQKASNKKSTITIPLLCRFVKLRRCLMIMTFLMEASRSKSSAWSLM